MLRDTCADDPTVRNVDGIEAYTALRALVLRPSRLPSIAPLAALTELELLEIGVTPDTDLTPLLACEALRRVRLHGFSGARQAETRRALEQARVIVDVVGERPAPDLAPFEDPMLKLAVLGALIRAGVIEEPELIPIDDDELDAENLVRLLEIPLGPDQLAKVRSLSWAGGGYSLQHLVWPQFDGESDEFALKSLRGLEALPNLEQLSVPDGCATTDEVAALRARGVVVDLRM